MDDCCEVGKFFIGDVTSRQNFILCDVIKKGNGFIFTYSQKRNNNPYYLTTFNKFFKEIVSFYPIKENDYRNFVQIFVSDNHVYAMPPKAYISKKGMVSRGKFILKYDFAGNLVLKIPFDPAKYHMPRIVGVFGENRILLGSESGYMLIDMNGDVIRSHIPVVDMHDERVYREQIGLRFKNNGYYDIEKKDGSLIIYDFEIDYERFEE